MIKFQILDESDPEMDSIPTSVEQYWDRYTRSWITVLRDQDGSQIDVNYDGDRASAARSKAMFEGMVK